MTTPSFPDAAMAQAFQAMPDAILAVDTRGVICFANSRAEALSGYSNEELKGQSVELLVPESQRSTHAKARTAFHAASAKREMNQRGVLTLQKKDGSLLPVTLGLSPLTEQGNNIVLSTIRDVSDLERRSREDSLLHELGALVSREHDFQQVCKLLANSLPSLLQFDRLVISVRVQGTDVVERAFVDGAEIEGQGVGTRAEGMGPGRISAASGTDPEAFKEFPEADQPFIDAGLLSWMGVPLGDQAFPSGYLSVRSAAKDAYRDEDVQLLAQVAYQVSPALGIARLYTELQVEATERTVLAEMSRIITSSTNIQDVYPLVADQARLLINFDRIVVSTVGQDSGSIVTRYVDGPYVEGREIGALNTRDETLLGKLLDDPRPRWFSSAEIEEARTDYPHMTETGVRSLVIAPLIWNDAVVGTLLIRSLTEDAYGQSDADMLMQIANQISGAVANAELLAQSRFKREETEVLAQISRVIASTSDIDDVYQTVAEQIGTLIASDRVIIETFDPQARSLTIRHISGAFMERRDVGTMIPIEDTIAADLIHSPRALSFNRSQIKESATQSPDMKFLWEAGVTSFVVAPLTWHDEVIGMLVARSTTEHGYGESEADVAMRIANQISGAVASAEILEQTRKESEEQAALAEISRIITSTADIQEVYEMTVELIRDLVPFDRIVISTIDRRRDRVVDRYVAGVKIPGADAGVTHPMESLTGRLMEDPEPRWFGGDELNAIDIRHPGEQERLDAGLRSIVTAPLIWDGKSIGRLLLRSEHESAYGDTEASLVMKIATQVSGAVANAELASQTLRETEERAVLAEIGRIVNSDIDLATVYATAADQVRRVIPFDRMAVISIDREHDVLRREYVTGLAIPGLEAGTTLKLAPGVTEFSLDEMGPAIGEYDAEMRRALQIDHVSTKSYMRAPLTVGATRFGYINLENSATGTFLPGDLSLLESIAEVLSPAIENAMLYEAARREARERTLLAEIGQVVSSSIDLREVYARFVELALQLIPADRVVISLIDVEKDEIIDDYVWGVEFPAYPEGSISRLSEVPRPEKVHGRSPIAFEEQELNANIDEFEGSSELGRTGLLSLLTVPFIWQDELIGVMNFRSKSPQQYSDDSVRIAELIAAQVVGVLASSREHGRVLEAEQARLEAESRERELERVNEEASNFLATVSHEFRTPLTSLVAFADILARNRDSNLTERQLDQVSVMQRSARRLNVLIGDLLDVSRLDAGTFKLSKDEFDVKHLLEELQAIFEPIVQEKNQSISATCPPGDIWIDADRDRVAQLITNLLSNASKYSRPDTEISLTASFNADFLCITIVDKGIGMSEETLDSLFTPFFRSEDEYTQSEPGTGLGLVIVKSLVELHGGTITVQSEAGVGTTVEVELPNCTRGPSESHLKSLEEARMPQIPQSRLDEIPESSSSPADG